MKKHVSLFCNIGSLFFILSSFKAGTALVYFLLAGQVPGTQIIVPATTMLVAYTVCAGIVTLFIAMNRIASFRRVRHAQKLSQLPRRRYAQAI
jgi:succinate dehydrogenase/fumarate reductase cytochrome b subunit